MKAFDLVAARGSVNAGWSPCGTYTSDVSSTQEFCDNRTVPILTFPRDKVLCVKKGASFL